jgi:uncharacterized protein YecT (DUF1311 family)
MWSTEGRTIMSRLLALAMIAISIPTICMAADRDVTAAALDRYLAISANASTAGQTECEAAAMRSYDRRMNATYAALMRRLPAQAADRLRRSQRAWLAFRDTEAQARSAIYATRQGTMYVPMEADAAVSLVGDRARLLERYAWTLDLE